MADAEQEQKNRFGENWRDNWTGVTGQSLYRGYLHNNDNNTDISTHLYGSCGNITMSTATSDHISSLPFTTNSLLDISGSNYTSNASAGSAGSAGSAASANASGSAASAGSANASNASASASTSTPYSSRSGLWVGRSPLFQQSVTRGTSTNIRHFEGINLWHKDLEFALNKQISIEMRNFITYERLSCFFRNASKGFTNVADYFRKQADEELSHARMFMDYQSMRGGTVNSFTVPATWVADLERSSSPCEDAFHLALKLEKDTYFNLLNLHKLSTQDPSFQDFIEKSLHEQLDAHKNINDKIIQLQGAKKNIGEYLYEINASS